jgi:hypothetical protein
MKKYMLFGLFLVLHSIYAFAQKSISTENIILVTYDGLRWQEVFSGAEKKLMEDDEFVTDSKSLKRAYWSHDPEERREKLMPFMWKTIASKGQIYGNRKYHNKVNTTNMFWFSYPGYNEILTGIKNDKTIFSNLKRDNPNVTILEYLNSLPDYHDKVAAFGSWDEFPYILNKKRSGLFVNAGCEPVQHENLSSQEIFLNSLQAKTPMPWTAVRLDTFTHLFAMEYLKSYSPKVLFISYGETDDIAHDGKYDGYLEAIHRTDKFISELWDYIQSSEKYRDKTTLIITTDHGRGHLFRSSWKKHGRVFPGSGQTWFAVMGPDTDPCGEVKVAEQLYQNQLASTMAAFLNVDYTRYLTCGNIINQVMRKDINSDKHVKPQLVGMLGKKQ